MSVHAAFDLVRDETIPEIASKVRMYRHKKTGAEVMSYVNDDENKVFGITFKTPPEDSTGVAHILEHSVLCGSRKYPVKKPFVELIKSSMNTFLNAMTFPDKTAPSPLDRVNRQFKAPAPNRLWVSDFTYVATWQGFVYVAFVIDAFARRIVGWRVSRTAHAGFVLDALEQALHDRRPAHGGGLVHHSDRGVQYVSIKYSERLAEAGIEPSVGSVGDSYDNALAETINGLYKAEVIWRQRSWPSASAVEMATLRWVDWFNNHRLFGPIGYIPPAEAEANYYAAIETLDMAA